VVFLEPEHLLVLPAILAVPAIAHLSRLSDIVAVLVEYQDLDLVFLALAMLVQLKLAPPFLNVEVPVQLLDQETALVVHLAHGEAPPVLVAAAAVAIIVPAILQVQD